MRYVALLRGINVGGNNLIPMARLRAAFESAGFDNVVTLIQSGNVVFDRTGTRTDRLERTIEPMLSEAFAYAARVVVRSRPQMERVLAGIPRAWRKPEDLRCYLAFLRAPTSPEDVVRELRPNDAVDAVEAGSGVVYMTTLKSGLTRSGFNRLVGTKVYKDMTIRNLTTTQRIVGLMQD